MNRMIPRKKAIRPAVILAAILFMAFVARVIFLVELERSELGDVLSLDSQLYYDVARDISIGGALPQGAFVFNPLLLSPWNTAWRSIVSDDAKRQRSSSSADRPTERALACRLLSLSAIAEGNRSEAILWVKRALVEVPGEPELTKMLKDLESAP